MRSLRPEISLHWIASRPSIPVHRSRCIELDRRQLSPDRGDPNESPLLDIPATTPSVDLSFLSGLSALPILDLPGQQLETGSHANSVHSASQHPHVEIYYTRFHAAHPFLPALQSLLGSYGLPPYLIDIMQFAGFMCCSSCGHDQTHFHGAAAQAAASSLQKVQALLILTILAHSQVQPALAMLYLGEAVQTALEIGIHRREYQIDMMASRAHRGAFQESARRTWWELVTVDALLTTLHQGGSLKVNSDWMDVPLPCDSEHLLDENHRPRTLQDLRNRIFAAEDEIFSSLAYRVEVVIILREVTKYVRGGWAADPDMYHILDARLLAWFTSLPTTKRSLLDAGGKLDNGPFCIADFESASLISVHTLDCHEGSDLWIFTDHQCPITGAIPHGQTAESIGRNF